MVELPQYDGNQIDTIYFWVTQLEDFMLNLDLELH